jgi:hypothetical protein
LGTTMSKKTTSPIPFATLQAVMNTLGYGVARVSHGDPAVVHWAQDSTNASATAKLADDAPKEVVTLQPDFIADGFEEPVYERDYVVDLIEHLTRGAKVSGKQILATLQVWGRAEVAHVPPRTRSGV